MEISRRSRGTPRVANRLLKRVRDFAQVAAKEQIDLEIVKFALEMLLLRVAHNQNLRSLNVLLSKKSSSLIFGIW